MQACLPRQIHSHAAPPPVPSLQLLPLPLPPAPPLPLPPAHLQALLKYTVFFLTTNSVFSELPLRTRLCVCVWHHERAVCCSAWLETAPAEERKGPFLEQGVSLLPDHRREQTHSANISEEFAYQLSPTRLLQIRHISRRRSLS